MYKEVMKWLRIQRMPVAESRLRLRLESHPDYPSLIAVQDTLEELGIVSYACEGTKEELKNENRPFLAHFNTGGGHVLFFKDVTTAEKKVKDFDKYWSGNIMFAEPAEKYGNPENSKLYKQERLNRFFAAAAIILFAGALLGLSIAAGSAPAIILIVSNFAGLYFSWLIAQKEFGISNSISDKICSMAKHSRCESVLFSKGAKLFNWLTWGDVGIVYFVSSLLYLLISQLTNQPINLYYLFSLAGLAFPVYSLYYQWKVVKQWCMLCIAVLAVLFINAGISLSYWSGAVWNETLAYASAIFILLLLFTLAAWQQIKALYRQSLALLPNEIKATRLKRNPQIFNALLQKEELNENNLPMQKDAIHFGNPQAPYQLLIACNPYCGPCAQAHHAIEDLYEKYPGKLSIAIRFALSNSDDKDISTLTAKEIIKAARQKPFEAIKDWYQVFDVDRFKQIHHTNGEDVSGDIIKHINWSKATGIEATPTFFVNGRRLPRLFSWMELSGVLEYELK